MQIELSFQELRKAEAKLLEELRHLRPTSRMAQNLDGPLIQQLTSGQQIADTVAATMGSWRFIILQSAILFVWIILNITAYIRHWGPYQFVLLNLALSFQAACAAPFIMMSQNRHQDIDRQAAKNDYKINIKAELEIEALHQKLDQLRETEVLYLTKAVRELTALLNRFGIHAPAAEEGPTWPAT